MKNSNRSPLPFWDLLALMAEYPCLTATEEESGSRLKLPEVPATITDPDRQREYTAIHYWQNFDFANTTLVNDVGYTEQLFVEFIDLLMCVPDETARRAIEKLMVGASAVPETFIHFGELINHYLANLRSPQHNEDFYILVLETIVSLKSVDPSLTMRQRHQLTMARKSRSGEAATDKSSK